MLSPGFPPALGIEMDGVTVTDDAATYNSMGLGFNPEMNIVEGGWMARALQEPALDQGILGNEAPKITYADLASRLAGTIHRLTEGKEAVVEIGGCPDDREAALPADAIRSLISEHGYRVLLHIVSKYDFTTNRDSKHDVKTRVAVRAIETSLQVYCGVALGDLRAYIRRADVPEDVSDNQLKNATAKVAFKTHLKPSQVFYVPNLEKPAAQLGKHIGLAE